MPRILTVAAAQMGPLQLTDSREVAVQRMLRLFERARQRGAELVVFPELALTTFFPRHYREHLSETDQWFEAEMPSPALRPLFDAAKSSGVGFSLGYAELALEEDDKFCLRKRRFNTQILVNGQGEIVLKYRKIHLPGDTEFNSNRAVQHLERRYFEVGNLGFPVIRAAMGNLSGINMGMMICNDRRWPEAWRVLGLQGVELILLGYNTPALNTAGSGVEATHLPVRQLHLSVQAGAYQNASFAVACAKAGSEDGVEMIGHSIIVNPQGEILAQATSSEDEVIIADCNLAQVQLRRKLIFDFDHQRQPWAYGPITAQDGAIEPPVWSRGGVRPSLSRATDKSQD